MKTNLELVKHCEKALSDKWRYAYGAFGENATFARVDALIKQYPTFNAPHKIFLYDAVAKSARLADCYGLIKSFLWWTSDTANPAYNAKTDRNTDSAYKAAPEKGAIGTLPEIPGLILYKPGHVGVYIGDGMFIEMQQGGTLCQKRKVSAASFTHWFKDTTITYLPQTPENTAVCPTCGAPWPWCPPAEPAGSAARIRAILAEAKFPQTSIAAILGNLYAESALIPNNLQNSFEKSLNHTDASYTAAVDAGLSRSGSDVYSKNSFTNDRAGYGLAQWSHWSRKEALYEFAEKAKTSIGDLTMQTNFLVKELTSYKSVMNVLSNPSSSLKDCCDIIITGFLKPADQSDAVKAKRLSYCKMFI